MELEDYLLMINIFENSMAMERGWRPYISGSLQRLVDAEARNCGERKGKGVQTHSLAEPQGCTFGKMRGSAGLREARHAHFYRDKGCRTIKCVIVFSNSRRRPPAY